MTERLPNIHPGEILLEDFIEPMGLTKNALATAIGVPATRIGEITRGARSVTADTDLRLSRFFGTSEGYWLRLQNAYDLEEAKRGHDYVGIKPHAA
ncbi:HigA family addiction module antidote protein [Halomonas sp. MCCC 1A11036]|uniref:HigA family addiction module antidote protein n=1 Tax=Billgrantia zhangzhouensis TaxID=2733481 RepID=A0ABS9AAF9_9GAMM|nr:HigA family addiction module antitoxin [Halomonas zhangzhouensis]MCE8018885.1 HigA family addiction module antidote protein [Halomonas zhangzhouensis]